MKRLLMGLTVLTVSTLITSNAMAQQRRGNGGPGQCMLSPSGPGAQSCPLAVTQRGNQVRPSPTVVLTDKSGTDLRRMWEEEKLAHDVYARLAKTSGLGMFQNIAGAERRHMQAIERLIQTGTANETTLKDSPGEFDFPKYQQLYDSLIASGTGSPLEALMVGAKIEEMDIVDLKRLIGEATDPWVRQVLENLMQASHNHLRAFASQIASRGESYKAEFLSQAEFDEIAESLGQGRGRQFAGRGGIGGGQGPRQRGGGGQQRGPRGPNFAGNMRGAGGPGGPGYGRQRRGR